MASFYAALAIFSAPKREGGTPKYLFGELWPGGGGGAPQIFFGGLIPPPPPPPPSLLRRLSIEIEHYQRIQKPLVVSVKV